MQDGVDRVNTQVDTGDKGWAGFQWTSNTQQWSHCCEIIGERSEQNSYIIYTTDVIYLF